MAGCDNSLGDDGDSGLTDGHVGDSVVAPPLIAPNPAVGADQLQVKGHQRADWYPRDILDIESQPVIYRGIERRSLRRQLTVQDARVYHLGFHMAYQDFRGGAAPGYYWGSRLESMCNFFAVCLANVAGDELQLDWVGPIFVVLEYFGPPFFDPNDIEDYAPGELGQFGYPYEDYIHQIEMATEFVERDRIFAPSDLQGEHATLRDAVLTDGWPSLEALDGKFIFIMKAPPDLRQVYLEDDWTPRFHFEPGDPRVFVTADSPEDDFAAFFSLFGADEVHRVAPLVDQGFIVHGGSEEAATVLDYRDAGAQLLTALHIDHADFEGPGRCNPRTATPQCYEPPADPGPDPDVVP